MTNTQITAYAEELAGKLTSIASLQSEAKDLINSAKDAGINTRALRKVARKKLGGLDERTARHERRALQERQKGTGQSS